MRAKNGFVPKAAHRILNSASSDELVLNFREMVRIAQKRTDDDEGEECGDACENLPSPHSWPPAGARCCGPKIGDDPVLEPGRWRAGGRRSLHPAVERVRVSQDAGAGVARRGVLLNLATLVRVEPAREVDVRQR